MTHPNVRVHVEAWRLCNDELDPVAVVLLLDSIGFTRQLSRDRIEVAYRACRWAGSVDDLCCFILQVAEERKPRNLPGYLRRCFESGDPGTSLRSHLKGRMGRGSETWSFYSPATERALSGDHEANAKKLLFGTAMALSVNNLDSRAAIWDELQLILRDDPSADLGSLLRLLPEDAVPEARELFSLSMVA